MRQLLAIYFLWVFSSINLWSQQGLKADYFDGTNFNRYVATEYVDNIDFYWNRKPPVEGINPHVCSVRYTGRLKSGKTGVYTFSARVDDGIRVWINEQLIIDNWQLNDVGYSKGKVAMEADSIYTIKIEYFNALAEAELQLLWELPKEDKKNWWDVWWKEDKRTVIPAQHFMPPLEKITEANPVPASPLLVNEKPKPKSKPNRVSQQKPIRPKPLVNSPKKKVEETMQNYLPKNVEFNQAESEILPVSYPELDKLANFLVENPMRKVRIEGHTDNVGDEHKNFLLSCLLYTSPSPRDRTRSRMPSSA